MPTIHELLDECQTQSQALVEEIEAFKQSRLLHQQSTEALESTAEALRETLRQVEPFTETRVRRLTYLIMSTALLNAVFFVLIVALIMSGR